MDKPWICRKLTGRTINSTCSRGHALTPCAIFMTHVVPYQSVILSGTSGKGGLSLSCATRCNFRSHPDHLYGDCKAHKCLLPFLVSVSTNVLKSVKKSCNTNKLIQASNDLSWNPFSVAVKKPALLERSLKRTRGCYRGRLGAVSPAPSTHWQTDCLMVF